MTKAEQYAKAIYAVKNPNLAQIKEVLQRRGHAMLLPAIYREYQKLVLRDERRIMHTRITPEQEQKRGLLELYRKLVASG